MKKIIKLATLGLLGTMAFTNATGVRAAEATPSVDETVKSLFETYYADGVYTKDTSIYMTDSAVLESIQYFHAGATQLERTTHYTDDALWMSRGNGEYSYYGTAYDGNGEAVGVTNATATIPLVAPKSAPVVLSGTGKESMENYYVTMKDFKEFNHEGKWTNVGGVYTTTDTTLVDYFRLFTAPCILDTTGSASNYLKFTKATVEESGTSLLMKLYVDGTDAEGKLTTTDGLFSQATLTNDNKYVVFTKQKELVNIPYASETNDSMYKQIAASDTGWIDVEGVAKYGIGHGTYNNYSLFNKNYLGNTSDKTISSLSATKQHFTNVARNDNIVTVIEANEHCFAKFTIDEEKLAYAFWSNIFIKKYTASTSSWTQVKGLYGPSTKEAALPYLWCDYVELNVGDKLTLEVICRAGGNNETTGIDYLRTITYPSGVAVAKNVNTYREIEGLEDVKSALLNTDNSFNAFDNIWKLREGKEDGYMSIGLLEGEKELPVAPGGANGWCGFTQDSNGANPRVQFLADTKPDAFYYTYTAKRSGYIYLDQSLRTWNGSCNSSVIATVNGEEVYNSGVKTHVGDGITTDKIAVYLEKGETFKIKVNHLSNPARSVFGFVKVNLTFVPSATEYALPEVYATLTDYITA